MYQRQSASSRFLVKLDPSLTIRPDRFVRMPCLRCVNANPSNVRKSTVVVNLDRVTVNNSHDFRGSVSTEIFNLWLLFYKNAWSLLKGCIKCNKHKFYKTKGNSRRELQWQYICGYYQLRAWVLVIKTAVLSGFVHKLFYTPISHIRLTKEKEAGIIYYK